MVNSHSLYLIVAFLGIVWAMDHTHYTSSDSDHQPRHLWNVAKTLRTGSKALYTERQYKLSSKGKWEATRVNKAAAAGHLSLPTQIPEDESAVDHLLLANHNWDLQTVLERGSKILHEKNQAPIARAGELEAQAYKERGDKHYDLYQQKKMAEESSSHRR